MPAVVSKSTNTSGLWAMIPLAVFSGTGKGTNTGVARKLRRTGRSCMAGLSG
jgi:hypothetical protein